MKYHSVVMFRYSAYFEFVDWLGVMPTSFVAKVFSRGADKVGNLRLALLTTRGTWSSVVVVDVAQLTRRQRRCTSHQRTERPAAATGHCTTPRSVRVWARPVTSLKYSDELVAVSQSVLWLRLSTACVVRAFWHFKRTVSFDLWSSCYLCSVWGCFLKECATLGVKRYTEIIIYLQV